MSDNQDPLRDLWQQQQVNQFDLAKLKKQWRKIRYKQFFYLFLDLLPVVAMPVILWLSYDRLEKTVFIALVIVAAIGTVFSGYIVWLRRHSFTSKFGSTSRYLKSIALQYKQNIKIARAAKYSTFAIPPLFIVMYLGFYLDNTFEWDRLVRKALSSGAMLLISLPLVWIWADKRMKKFIHELEKLEEQMK